MQQKRLMQHPTKTQSPIRKYGMSFHRSAAALNHHAGALSTKGGSTTHPTPPILPVLPSVPSVVADVVCAASPLSSG